MRHLLYLLAILAVTMISACSKVESDWKSASETNSIAAYEQHLAEFPESPHAAEARTAITQLEWQAAQAAGTVAAIEQFISAHPEAPQLDDAAVALEELHAAIQEEDLANMADKLRAFLDGDESSNVIAKIGSQEFVPRSRQPQSNVVVHGGSQMMAIIGGAARVVYIAGDANLVAAVEEYEFAIGAPIEMTNGNAYTWQDGEWLAE